MAGFPKCNAIDGNVTLVMEMFMPPRHHSDRSVGDLADTVPEALQKAPKTMTICFVGEKPSWLKEDAQVNLAANYYMLQTQLMWLTRLLRRQITLHNFFFPSVMGLDSLFDGINTSL